MESKLKYLEFIQAAIARMSNISLLVKGWSVTLTVALLSLESFSAIAIFSVFFLWALDAKYLRLEIAYRDLYDKVRVSNEEDIDFNMNVSDQENPIIKVMRRKSLLFVYCALFLSLILFKI